MQRELATEQLRTAEQRLAPGVHPTLAIADRLRGRIACEVKTPAGRQGAVELSPRGFGQRARG